MRLLSLVSMVAAVLLLIAAGWGQEETKAKKEEVKFEYVGAKKCKICHKEVHKSWSETKHASAFEVLSDEEKKKPECIKCHITGKMADGTVIEGVECEACHGPGSEYKSIKIMNKKKWAADPETQRKMAIEAGLIYPPTEEDCTRCHRKEGNPNFKEFVFAERKDKVHIMPSDTTAAAKEKGETPKPTKETKEESENSGK
jgi:hypothetical protein